MHVTRMHLKLDAETTDGPINTENVSTAVPLPVVLFLLGYTINPKWSWTLDSQFFSMDLGELSGTYNDATARIGYQAWENIALGFGLGVSNLSVETEQSNQLFTFRQRITGGIFYLAANF